MTNKLYKKIKKILCEDTFFAIMFILFIFIFIEFPYYINGSGGITNLDKKVIIDNEYKSKGSFNMVYVAEYKANIYTMLYALINPKVDTIKKSDYIVDGDTHDTMMYRERLQLEESLDSSLIFGYKMAGHDVLIKDSKTYITYIYKEANTDLEIKDQIIKINGEDIKRKSDISKIINKYNENDKLNIEVIRDGSHYMRYAYVGKIDDFKYIGVYLTEDIDYEVDQKIKFNFNKNESGPSGGVMLALEIYNSLVEEDITKGYKIAGTGMIDSEGNILPIGGVKYKVMASSRCKVLFVPEENFEEALETKNKYNYKQDIVSVSNISDIYNYLNELK